MVLCLSGNPSARRRAAGRRRRSTRRVRVPGQHVHDVQPVHRVSGTGRRSGASGNFVVVWSSNGQDGDNYGVFAQRYDSAGGTLGAEFRVNSYTTSRQNSPSVASDASGNFIVIWESHSQDGHFFGIYGQRYDNTGRALGAEFQVNTFTGLSQTLPSVASDASGNFVVIWTSFHTGEGGEVFARRHDSAGKALGTEFRANSYSTGSQSAQSIASDPSGNFVV